METWNDIRHADILAPTEDSASVPMNDFSDVPSLSTNDEVVDMGTDFDFEGFQVVRREFFAHLHEPSVTFNNYKFYVNCACLNKFPEASFVQVLVNQETKIMALRPCVENARDSFAWCGISKKKRSLWGDRIFEKCGIGRDERGDGGKTLEIRGKRRLSARDGGANYQQS